VPRVDGEIHGSGAINEERNYRIPRVVSIEIKSADCDST